MLLQLFPCIFHLVSAILIWPHLKLAYLSIEGVEKKIHLTGDLDMTSSCQSEGSTC